MAINSKSRGVGIVVLALGATLALAACSSGGATPAATTASGSSALGTVNKATGTPIVFGVLNLESGPVTFPEVVLAEKAAAEYVNEYKGGIGGHPIKIVSCATDGSPATSARCANQILDQKPVAIFGGADTGAPGAIPVWERAGLAYLGGVPFTPVEQNSKNAVIFSSVSTADNAAASVYAAKTLGAKSAAVIYTSDTQGTASAEGAIIPTMKNAGISKITPIAIAPTASDVSAAVATAVGANPDVIYVDAPGACPNILNSLKQLANTAKILGIDPCTSPAAIKGANGGAEGMYFATPVLNPTAGTADTKLYLAALQKYAPADIALDSLAALGFQTVINVQAALAKFTTADLTKDKILAAFTTGSDHANFMGHPYTCDGNQLAGATAVCNAYQQIRQIKGGVQVVASADFVTPGKYYTPKH
jgi:branched-chain amino acid transport system substrate-binding protein